MRSVISVFFDANVWLPATVSDGWMRRLVREAELRATVWISAELLDEAVEKLALKFHASWETIEGAKALMAKSACMFSEKVPPDVRSPDPDDALLLAQALAAKCTHFVTNDKPLLALAKVDDMQVVSPSTFAELLGVR